MPQLLNLHHARELMHAQECDSNHRLLLVLVLMPPSLERGALVPTSHFDRSDSDHPSWRSDPLSYEKCREYGILTPPMCPQLAAPTFEAFMKAALFLFNRLPSELLTNPVFAKTGR